MGLRFEDIHHHYGKKPALRGLSFAAKDGEILCLLGRSGCGKSTLLNLTAGLFPVQHGEIWLGDAPLASATFYPPPEKRPVGLVFQDGALFPHLTVAQNIGFGVAEKSAREAIVAELLDQIGLSAMAARYPHTLSGGEQQRVAVARALAPRPAVMLMDEPFASIDITLRRQLREDTRRLIKARGGIALLVTHDPEEAIEIADRIAVLEEGRITQVGTAKALHDDPASLFVGMMAENGTVVPGEVRDGDVHTAFGTFALDALRVKTNGGVKTNGSGPVLKSGELIDLLIYPHRATLSLDPDGARIVDIRQTGRSQIIRLEGRDGTSRLFDMAPEPSWLVGQTVQLKPAGESWLAFVRPESG